MIWHTSLDHWSIASTGCTATVARRTELNATYPGRQTQTCESRAAIEADAKAAQR
jgi:hypothetical protein